MKNNDENFIVIIFIFAALVLATIIVFSMGFNMGQSILNSEDKRECTRWKNWIHSGNIHFHPSEKMKRECRQVEVELSVGG